jgi:putative transcriptional regulator
MDKGQKKGEIRAADLIREGLEEAVAFVRGKDTGARVHRVHLTARHVTGRAAPPFDKSKVVRLRTRMGLSQTVFADALNVSPETVRAWEQGKNSPSGPALRLLEIATEQPEVVLKRLHVHERAPARKVRVVSLQYQGTAKRPAAKK